MAQPPSRRERGVRRADGTEDRIAGLKDLADLKTQGTLSDDEGFAARKPAFSAGERDPITAG